MSLRAQSLLNLKMYKLKKHELKVILIQLCCLAPVLWVRDDLLWIRILSLTSFRIRILSQNWAMKKKDKLYVYYCESTVPTGLQQDFKSF